MTKDVMLDGFRENLGWELERIMDCARSAGDARGHWRPAGPDANSVHGIAAHALGAAREHVLVWALGETGDADGDAFDSGITLALLEARYEDTNARLDEAFEQLAIDDIGRPMPTPGRGPQPIRDILLWSVLHAAEHAGEAELTRDLAMVAMPGLA